MDIDKNLYIIAEPLLSEKIFRIMLKHFQYGFKINSFIELTRFRQFVSKEYGDEISISDEHLKKYIASFGILFEDKVYIVDNNTKRKIKQEIDSIILDGFKIIFYSSFYEKHRSWLFPERIISDKMLKNILMDIFPRYKHKESHLSVNKESISESESIKKEIICVWDKDILLSFQQLSKRLPYIPLERIRNILKNREFIHNATDTYTHISKVEVNDEECAAIADYVACACQKIGYASMSDVPLEEIEERNYELTCSAIHKAVFEIALADKYAIQGKIVAQQGDKHYMLSIMEAYCRTLDRCSLQDLLNFQEELTGVSYRWTPMKAAYSIMVRVDKDNYIAEKYVAFDVSEIDTVLDHFVIGEYLPLKNVTTFAVFPHCGQSWNLFLLESYCRRFSKNFRFDLAGDNSKNVGVIARKSCLFSYTQIMADAVAESNIALEKGKIEDFLYNNGYIGRRSFEKIAELIKLAKDIRRKKG